MSIRQGKKLIASSTTNGFNLFDCKWADHILNNISWLRADTFSWQSGDVYVAAYQHLVGDLDTVQKLYCWLGEKMGHKYYTYSESPSVGETTTDGDAITSIDSYGRPVVGAEYLDRNPDGDILSTQTDTIGDITITYALSEDGHKICLPDQESNLVALYNTTGVAWYYLLDTTNRQFKLPRTKWGFTGLRDSVGKYIPESLPNITGQIASDRFGVYSSRSSSGAFSVTDGGVYGAASNTGESHMKVSFSAHNSNTTYQDGAPVQERATQMYLYFYVGNFEQSAIEQTAGLNAEMFNDLNAHKVIEFQAPTSANNYTWYRKYADGWVEQGGIVFPTTTTPTRVSITLPVIMSSNMYSVQVTGGDNAAGTDIYSYYTNRTTTGFEILYSHTTSSYTIGDSWQVSGMSA